MVKKWLVTALVVLLLANTVGISAAWAQVTDVSPDHWAHRAILTLLEKGYVTLYEDETFRGDQAVDRFTLAVALAQILEDIEAGRVKSTSEELALIRKLSLEFEEELALWHAARESLQEEVSFLWQTIATVEDSIRQVGEAQLDLDGRIKATLNEVDQLGSHTGVLDEGLVEYKEQLEQVVQAAIQLEKELRAQEQDLHYLKNWKEEKEVVIAALQLQIEEDIERKIEEEIGTLTQRSYELEKDLQSLAILLQREVQRTDKLALELEATQDQLGQARAQLSATRDTEELLNEFQERMVADLNVQVNAAIVREKRLERQLTELEEEFDSYRHTTEQELKSSKTMTTVALAIAAASVVIGLISGK